uniref:Homologous recombination OB-fold protein OB-fold domain-containing protein n=1 Tax=Tanacetum cinerariifolium TaxID=118510 RepID=A0A6L2P1K8_TANCI|nr:hypothetical protein [Tanacetum cinerariifolium]
MLTQEYVRKITEEASDDDHFTCGPWLRAVQYLAVEGSITTGCFGDMKTFIKNGKVEKVVALIKSCTPNMLGDLTVTLKDLSVLNDEVYGKAISVGAVLILRNVSVFSPKLSGLYLNITLKNIVKVFHKDASAVNSGRSLTGYCIFIGHSLVSRKTKKQPTVYRSSTEAKYGSMATTTMQQLSIQQLRNRQASNTIDLQREFKSLGRKQK